MPIFEFSCTQCTESFEELVRSADAINQVKCPTCRSPRVERKISLVASKVKRGGAFASAPTASCAPSAGG
ncbi:MAG: zinc ribbon domain-containing protein [Chloroflexi bacterium]|nr:zinc ribbon domain-containing protein [Chloroflexota bacterium]